MKTKKTTRTIEITLETDEYFVIRKQRKIMSAWCPQCAREVRVVTVEEAVALTGISSRVIHRRAEAAQIHFTETPAGLLLVCLNSLS